jgi:hypothetical protein
VYELQSEDAGERKGSVAPETFQYVRLSKQRAVEDYIRENTDFSIRNTTENRQASGVGMHQGTTRLLFDPGAITIVES